MTYLNFVSTNRNNGFVNDYYIKKTIYENRYQLHEILQRKLNITQTPTNYLEFGVAKGDMIIFWASKYAHKNSLFIGFDSF
jgi:hypothetical protein